MAFRNPKTLYIFISSYVGMIATCRHLVRIRYWVNSIFNIGIENFQKCCIGKTIL